MKYSFDYWGWFTLEVIPSRQTEIAPPPCGTPVVGEPYPNFTGYEWILLPYSDVRNIALVKGDKIDNIIVASLEFAQTLPGYDEVFDTSGMNVGVGWVRVNGVWTDPGLVPIPVMKSVLTPLEFLNRFTDSEIKTIMALAKTDPDVELWWLRYNKAQDMNLEDPQTIEGVNMLEQATIIAPGRAAEILTIYPI